MYERKSEILKAFFKIKLRVRRMNLLNRRSVYLCQLEKILDITGADFSKHISKLRRLQILKEQ